MNSGDDFFFLDLTPQAMTTAEMNMWDYIKLKLLHSKTTTTTTKKPSTNETQSTEWEKIFAKYLFDKRFIVNT